MTAPTVVPTRPGPVLRFPAARFGCRLVRGDLPDSVLEWGPMAAVMANHLATCLACQADEGPGRAVAELVGELADGPLVPAPPGFVESVVAGLGRPTRTELRRRRAAIGWSAGAASAAIVSTALVILRRSKG